MLTLRTKITAVLVGTSGALALAASAQIGTPLIQYGEPTWDTTGANPVNTGSLGGTGTYNVPSTVDFGSGPVTGSDAGNSVHFNDGVASPNQGNLNLGTGISTGHTLATLSGATDQSFTMSAWVNLDFTAATGGNDQMVFGSSGGNPIHFGFRGDQAYMGFWNNDLTGAHGTAPANNTWNYFTWVFNGTTGSASKAIYENGVQVAFQANGGPAPGQQGETVEVGTTGGNGGDLGGSIDDARIYNVAFSGTGTGGTDAGTGSAGQTVAALYADAQLVDSIPEPSTIAAILGGAGMLLGLRRRRS